MALAAFANAGAATGGPEERAGPQNQDPFRVLLFYADGTFELSGMTLGADNLNLELSDEFPDDFEISGLGGIRLGSKTRCFAVNEDLVRCPRAGLDRLLVDLGEGDDDVRVRDSGFGTDLVFRGGRGNDFLKGGPDPERFDGGLGDDFIDSGAGRDRLIGGPGNDRLLGRGGVDVFSGGPGNDFARGGGGDDRGAGGPGKDDFKD